VQSLNDLGLHHQLQARGVTTIKDALREGKTYLLAKQLHGAHVSSQQITVEPGPDNPTRVAAATTIYPFEAEVDRMTTMLEKLVAVLARAKPTEPTQEPLRPGVEAPRSAALCWECGARGHLRSSCPQCGKRLNFNGPRTPPNPASRKCRTSKAGTTGCPYGHRVIPPMSGKHPVGPVDQCGDRNRLPCHSPTALTGSQR